MAVQRQLVLRENRPQTPSVSVVLPVYNEKDSLRSLRDALRQVTERSPDIGILQIIFVDDGSTDGSWPLITQRKTMLRALGSGATSVRRPLWTSASTRQRPTSSSQWMRTFRMIRAKSQTGVKLRDMNCGFKAYRREVFNSIVLYGELHRYIPVLADSVGYRVAEISVKHHPRQLAVSNMDFSAMRAAFSTYSPYHDYAL